MHGFHTVTLTLEGLRNCLQRCFNFEDNTELSLQLGEGGVRLVLDTVTDKLIIVSE